MQKGIYTVGFPDLTKLKVSSGMQRYFKDAMKPDQEHLRQLVYTCNEMKQIIKDDKCSIS